MLREIFLFLYIILCSCRVTFSNGIKSSLLPSKDMCGLHAAERIFGGIGAGIEEFPWLALLESKEDGLVCGGVLINNRYVLTAAHCIDDHITSVRLGEQDVTKDTDCEEDEIPGFEYCADPPVNIGVEEKIVHSDFNNRNKFAYGDIALLRLKTEVNYTKFIQPICLPLSRELRTKTFEGKKGVVAGWGRTEKKWESDVKLKVEVPIKSNEECAKVYSRHEVDIKESQICAGGEKGKDSCEGDSGGPLMFHDVTQSQENWICIGIVSFGTEVWDEECGTENVPGVYTRVTEYMQWILDNIKP